MKQFLISLCILTFCGFLIYFVPSSRNFVIDIFSYSQCDKPLPYKIGSIDSRFGLSQGVALTDSKEATDTWSTAYGKNLFTYSPQAELTINFVYDQRQALDTKINQLHLQIDQKSTTLQKEITNYEADVRSYEQRLQKLNSTIDKYNKEGGAPEDIYKDLVQQQQQLKAEGDGLNARAKALNLKTNDYNANISVLNNDVEQLNNDLSKKPEEGLYDGNDTTITLYFAQNHDRLLHTLTHEFGHALGMIHVTNADAIMYPYTTEKLQVTTDDLEQLRFVCREQSAILHWLSVLDVWLSTHVQAVKQQISGT